MSLASKATHIHLYVNITMSDWESLTVLLLRYLRDNITALDEVIINSTASLMLSSLTVFLIAGFYSNKEIHELKWFKLAVHLSFFSSK